jgi:predicted lipoprotein with Yx(FWY)xxD motif
MTNRADATSTLRRRGRLVTARRTGVAHPATAVAAMAAVALTLAACGSSTTSSASTGTSAASATVKAGSTSAGTILENSAGMALYTLAAGTSCTGACASAWPAGSTPTAGPGVTGTLATSKQSNGTLQVTYNGKPLYTFIKDTSPGQATGNGVHGFSVASVAAASGTSSNTTTSAKGSGY